MDSEQETQNHPPITIVPPGTTPSVSREVWDSLFSPLVALVTSPDANEVFRCNGLRSVEEYFAPFGSIRTSVTVHDVHGGQSLLDYFHVRFRDPAKLRSIDAGAVNQIALEALERAPRPGSAASPFPKDASLSDLEPTEPPATSSEPSLVDGVAFMDKTPQLSSAVTAAATSTPWFRQFAKDVCCQIGTVEHESFNHPVACFMVVSTLDRDPVSTLVQLFNSGAAAIPGNDKGYLDPNFLRYYILVQDRHKTTDEQADVIFQTIRKSFGLQTVLLRVNSVPNDPAVGPIGGTLSSFWADAAANRPGPGSAPVQLWSTFLSAEDIDSTREFIGEFVMQHLIPHMEKTVANLNEQVASARRGLTGRLFTAGRRYFGVGSSSKSPTSASSFTEDGYMTYAYSTPEAQMRRLADFAFMLGDYRLAHGVYDTVRKDFQLEDKAVKYFAGTTEMVGLCNLLLDTHSASTVRSTQFEACVDRYRDTKSKLMILRATLAYLAAMEFKGAWKEAAGVCLKAVTLEDSDLLSALLLEQAAVAFLRNVPPLKRKFAFHMVLAGHRFHKCGERDFAARCYHAASAVYHLSTWTLAEDHINFTLGRQSYHLNDLQQAMEYFLRLLRTNRQPPAQQEAYISEFLHVCDQYAAHLGGRLPRVTLAVPEFQASSAKLTSLGPDQRQSGSNIGSAGDEAWLELEESVVERGLNAKGRVARPIAFQRTATEAVGAVGEPLYLTVAVRNPLAVAVSLHNVRVMCSFGDSKVAELDPDKTSGTDTLESRAIARLDLSAGESATLDLMVIPGAEGKLTVWGVAYDLFSKLPCFYRFLAKPKRGEASGPSPKAAPLQAKVMHQMPLLQARVVSMPERLFSGEAKELVLELSNQGSRRLTNLSVSLSHPGFFSFGTSAAATAAAGSTFIWQVPNSLQIGGVVRVSDLLEVSGRSGTLDPGETVRLPLWIRGDRIGKQLCRLLFAYQSEASVDSSNYRLLRVSLPLTVQPSLRISAFTRPSARHLDEYLLGLEVENLNRESPAQIDFVSAISCKWEISPMDDDSSNELYRAPMEAQEERSFYLRLGKRKQLPVVWSKDEVALAQSVVPVGGGDSSSARLEGLAGGPFALSSRHQWRSGTVAERYPNVAPSNLASLFPLFRVNDVDFAVGWHYPSLNISGTHFVMGINLGLGEELPDTEDKIFLPVRERRDNPLRLLVRAPASLAHDFSAEKICSFPVTVYMENISDEVVAAIDLKLPQRGMDWPPDGVSIADADPEVDWLGEYGATVTLKPGESQTLVFEAAVMNAGCYDVGRYHVKVDVDDSLGRRTFTQRSTIPIMVLVGPDIV